MDPKITCINHSEEHLNFNPPEEYFIPSMESISGMSCLEGEQASTSHSQLPHQTFSGNEKNLVSPQSTSELQNFIFSDSQEPDIRELQEDTDERIHFNSNPLSFKDDFYFSQVSKWAINYANYIVQDIQGIDDLKKLQSSLSQEISTHFPSLIKPAIPVRVVNPDGSEQTGTEVEWNDPHITGEGRTLANSTIAQMYFFDRGFFKLLEKKNLCEDEILKFEFLYLKSEDWELFGPTFLGQPFFKSHLSPGIRTTQSTFSAFHLAQLSLFRYNYLISKAMLINKALMRSVALPNHTLLGMSELCNLRIYTGIKNFSIGTPFPHDFWKSFFDYVDYLKISISSGSNSDATSSSMKSIAPFLNVTSSHSIFPGNKESYVLKTFLKRSLFNAQLLIENSHFFISNELHSRFSRFIKIPTGENLMRWNDMNNNENANRIGSRILFKIHGLQKDLPDLAQNKFPQNDLELFKTNYLKQLRVDSTSFLGHPFFEENLSDLFIVSKSSEEILSALYLSQLLLLHNKQCLAASMSINKTLGSVWKPRMIKFAITCMYDEYLSEGIEEINKGKTLPRDFWSKCDLFPRFIPPSFDTLMAIVKAI